MFDCFIVQNQTPTPSAPSSSDRCSPLRSHTSFTALRLLYQLHLISKSHTGWHVLQRAWLKPHINTRVFSHNLLGGGAKGYFTSEDNISTLNGPLNNRARTHTHTQRVEEWQVFTAHPVGSLTGMEEWDRFSTNKPTFYFFSSHIALILIRGAMRQETPSMQFPSVSCKGEILLISERLWKCTWACARVYYILRACPSQGRTSNGRPVSQLVAGLNWRMNLVPFPFLPSCKHTHNTHQNPSISTALFACYVKYVIPAPYLLLLDMPFYPLPW